MRAQQHSLRNQNLGRFLVDSSPALWLFTESLMAWAFFYFFAQFGKGANFVESQIQNHKAAFLFAMIFGIVGVSLGLFEKETRFNRLKSLQTLSLTSFIAAICGLFVLYLTSYQIVGRWSLFLGSGGATLALYILIHLTGATLLYYFPHSFLIVGKPSPVGQQILDSIRESNVSQFKHAQELHTEIFDGDKLKVSGSKELVGILKDEGIADLVVRWDAKTSEEETYLLLEGLKQGVRIVDDVQFFTFMARRIPIESLPLSYILKLGLDTHQPFSSMIKRLLDIIFALVLGIGLLPLFVLTSLLIALEDGFPVFYTQNRFGRHGKKFNLYKFRSMKKNLAGPGYTRTDDPRITKVGKIIRRLHIDEFPQLINILKGDMSFVGPRPEASEIVEEKSELIPLMHLRHVVRPGLTGHAQITQGKTEDSVEDLQVKLSYDLYYIKNLNLFFDLTIIIKTLSRLVKSTW